MLNFVDNLLFRTLAEMVKSELQQTVLSIVGLSGTARILDTGRIGASYLQRSGGCIMRSRR